MFLIFESRTPCVLCGYRLRAWLMNTWRINKRSIAPAGTSPSLGACDRFCPECCTRVGADLAGPVTYQLTADSAAKVAAYRLRRWPELAGEVT